MLAVMGWVSRRTRMGCKLMGRVQEVAERRSTRKVRIVRARTV